MANPPDTRLIAGCMTGTSLDGLDAALVAITGHGLDMRAKFIGMVSRQLGDLRDELHHFASGGAAEPIRYLRAARRLGELNAEAVAALCEQEGCKQLDFVVAHGQTIWHAPGDRGKNPPAEPGAEGKMDAGVSWQLFDPWPIVRQLVIPVCYDLRQADLIAGGQGAPITPLSDWVMYRDVAKKRVIANLGGICNIAILQPGKGPEWVTGGDIGPCNLLIDGVVRELFPGLNYDVDGQIARRGGTSDEFPNLVRRAPFFKRAWPRSTGREDFDEFWITSLIDGIRTVFPGWESENIVCSAVYAVADLVAYQGIEGVQELILAGGGARNTLLIEMIRSLCIDRNEVVLSDDLGIPCEAREAMGFAVLGALSQDGVPITLPQVTGAKEPGRAGAWVYP